MNCVISDLMIAAYGLPVDFTAALVGGWKLGKDLCLATGFILTTAGEASIVSLAVLSVERCLTIRSPKKYKITSYRTSARIIWMVWLYSLCFSIPPFLGFGKYVPETSGMTCAPDWESNEHLVFTWYWVIFGFLAPLVAIFVSNIATIWTLKKGTKSTQSTGIKRVSQKRQKNVSTLVFLMNLAFIVGWMPYAIVCFCHIFGGKGFVPPVMVVFPLVTAKLTVCFNPVLYVVMNTQVFYIFRCF